MDNTGHDYDRGFHRGVASCLNEITELRERLSAFEQSKLVPEADLNAEVKARKHLQTIISDQAKVIERLCKERDQQKKPVDYNHPLLSTEEVDRLLKSGVPLHEVMMRGTGKSTAQALSYLAWGIKHPGKRFKVYDHYGTLQATNNLLSMMQDVADKLGLKHFVFSRADQTVCFGKPQEIQP